MRLVRQGLLSAQVCDTGLVIGCSGGPDSTALMLALGLLAPELRLELRVAAIDHGLRPEAGGEAAAVCKLAEALGLAAECIAVRVPPGASRQAQAREVRYQALAEAARRHHARYIAVGHTRDDQTETVLMRLLGGAGLTGLAGMALTSELPVECPAQASLLRPLLTVSRAQVEAFLQPLLPLLAPLPFHDPSNGDPRYLRARLRRDVLPLLRDLAPHLDDRILHLSDQLRADAEHLEQSADAALRDLLPAPWADPGADAVTLQVTAIAALPRALQARVLQRAARVSLGQRHVEALMGLCRTQAGTQELHLPAGLHACRRGNLLTLTWHSLTRPSAC